MTVATRVTIAPTVLHVPGAQDLAIRTGRRREKRGLLRGMETGVFILLSTEFYRPNGVIIFTDCIFAAVFNRCDG